MSEADLAAVWARSLDELAEMHIEPAQRAWLQLTRPLGLVENTALIATPNEFVKEQLETRLRSLITNALSRELGRSIQLAVTVDPAVISSLPSPDRDRDLNRGRDLGSRDGTGLGQPAGPPMDHRLDQEPDVPLSAGGLNTGGLGGIDPVTGRPRPMSAPGQPGQGQGPGLGALGTGPGHGHGSGLGPQGGLAGAPAPARRGSTRSTPSRPSSSAPATGLPTLPPSRSPKLPPRPTTRCSSTATPGWARRTCCTRSAITHRASIRASACAT